MTGILAMVLKELKLLLRDPGGLTLLFVMPAAFILVFSLALQGVFSSADTGERMDVLVLDLDEDEAGRRIVGALGETGHFRAVEELEGGPLTRERVTAEIDAGSFEIAVIIPPGSTAAASHEATATIEVLADPLVPEQLAMAVSSCIRAVASELAIERLEESIAELEKAIDTMETDIGELDSAASELEEANAELLDTVLELHGHLEKAVRLMPPSMRPKVSLAEMQERREDLERRTEEAAAKREARSRKEDPRPPDRGRSGGLDVEQRYASPSGSRVTPNSVQQNVPGWTIFAMFWIVQTLALTIIAERTSGAYSRILISPLALSSYITGKALPYLAVNLVQALLMFAIGVLILPLLGAPRLEIPDVPAAIVLTLAISLTAIALGLLMASLSRSALFMGAFTAAMLVIMAAISGIMVPSFVMPSFMQKMTLAVPQGWALAAYHDILVRDRGLADILPHLGALLAFAAVFSAGALLGLSRMDRIR